MGCVLASSAVDRGVDRGMVCAYLSGAHQFNPVIMICVAQSLVFCAASVV